MVITNQARSHRRLAAFVDWIKPDPDARDTIREQAGNIRQAIKQQAVADGLIVIATPNGGSFAKRTGLRRHMRGNTEIEGQDVDLPFVVKPETTEASESTNCSSVSRSMQRQAIPALPGGSPLARSSCVSSGRS